jgi:hypothetical protein
LFSLQTWNSYKKANDHDCHNAVKQKLEQVARPGMVLSFVATVKIGNVPWNPPKSELTVHSSIWWTFLKVWDQMKTTSFCCLSLTCFNKYFNHSKGVIYPWRKVVCFVVLFVCHIPKQRRLLQRSWYCRKAVDE